MSIHPISFKLLFSLFWYDFVGVTSEISAPSYVSPAIHTGSNDTSEESSKSSFSFISESNTMDSALPTSSGFSFMSGEPIAHQQEPESPVMSSFSFLNTTSSQPTVEATVKSPSQIIEHEVPVEQIKLTKVATAKVVRIFPFHYLVNLFSSIIIIFHLFLGEEKEKNFKNRCWKR